MTFDAHSNFAVSLVATAPGVSGTTLGVTTGDGGKFPAVPFNMTVWPAGSLPTEVNAEIVRVTSVATDSFTITRAQESTSAKALAVGYQCAATITAKTLIDIENAITISGGGGGVLLGGDLGGTNSVPVVETVKGGKTPLTADQNLGDLSNATAARANLGLGSIATHPTSDFDAAGTATSAVATETARAGAAEALLAPLVSPGLTGSPTAPTATPGDNSTTLANTAFVTAAVQASQAGLLVHTAAKEATTAALPANTYTSGVLTATGNGALTVDGVVVSVNDRVLVKNEATAANNGVYAVTAAGDASDPYVLTRVSDMNTGTQVPGAFVFVQSGTVNTGAGFSVVGSGPFTIGSTAIPWTQFSGAGQITAGLAISITGNQISAILGTTGSTAAAGNDTRITGAAQKANNLSDLLSASSARANLGLGSAATSSTSAFDAAGSAAAAQAAAEAASVPLTEVGVASGVASLDSGGDVPVGQLGNVPHGPVFVQDSAPSPASGFGEYIWFQMDGSGNLLDIQAGIA